MAATELPEMPNGPVMELHGQRKRFHVPHGLKPLLEDMTREVLRYQPNDVYAFLSKFMEIKLAKREAAKAKKSRSGSKDYKRWNSLEGPDLLDPEELMDMLETLGITKEEADRYAIIIQSAYRGHLYRKRMSTEGKNLHKDHRKSWQWKKWSWEGSSKLNPAQLGEFLQELDVDLETANKHATKIQVLFLLSCHLLLFNIITFYLFIFIIIIPGRL
jgi:hypothetical protein